MLVERHKFLALRLLIRFGGKIDKVAERIGTLAEHSHTALDGVLQGGCQTLHRIGARQLRETGRSARLVQNRQVLGEHAKVVAKTLFVAFDLAIDALDILRKATAFALDIVVFDQIPLRLPFAVHAVRMRFQSRDARIEPRTLRLDILFLFTQRLDFVGEVCSLPQNAGAHENVALVFGCAPCGVTLSLLADSALAFDRTIEVFAALLPAVDVAVHVVGGRHAAAVA